MFRLWNERREILSLRPTIKPTLETVEERILPSAATVYPLASVAVASPPAAPSVAAVVSFVEATMDQVMAAEQQEVRALVTIIAQEQAYFIQEVEHFFGIPSPANPTLDTTAQKSGSGSGSGTGTMPPQPIVPKPGDPRTPPVTKGSGIGFDAGPGSGGGLATIYGQVWLDNNGNGIEDNSTGDVELGYSNVTVWLCTPSGQQIESTTTDTNGDYQFSDISAGGQPPTNQYEIQVIFPFGMMATYEGADSYINNQGFTPVYTLAPNETLDVPAGFLSMNVNTTADDDNGPLKEKITLRDAIETGNNGPPATAVTFFTSPNNPLTGTINLQGKLPNIDANYMIAGPGASILTVQGIGLGSVFVLDTNNKSTIYGLTITGGGGDVGGGVANNGYLTLWLDIITGNKVSNSGGGVFNEDGAVLTLKNSAIYNNSAGNAGGGIGNDGKLNIIQGSDIYSNQAFIGGGLGNSPKGTAFISGASIDNNQANDNGGGICNSGTITMTGWGGSGKINDNQAVGAGGGIYNNGGILTLKNSVPISNNTASGEGGGIYIKSGRMTMSGGGISSNQANSTTRAGGGIYLEVGAVTLTKSVRIFHNKASGSGAGMFIQAGGVTVSGGTIDFNTAQNSGNGGGIYLSFGTLTLKGGVYFGPQNSANQGGGMYLAKASTTTFNVVTVAGNVADLGAGVYWQNGANVNPNPPVPPALSDKDDPGGKPFQGP